MKLQDILYLPPEKVIPYFLGSTLTSVIDGVETGGVICELEAYLASGDAAAHNSRGQTIANQALFADAGTLYVHQMRQWLLLDIVTEAEGVPSSILVRGIKPTTGIKKMKNRRNENNEEKLMDGPGKVCQALGINKEHNGVNIFDKKSPIKITLPVKMIEPSHIACTKRIGISKNSSAPLRFLLKE